MSSETIVSDLRKLQLVQLSLLREVDRICRAHGIRYYLVAGTLLGAVRHAGFIPWDDDLDIKMPYRDYLRFCEICKTELDPEKYFLQNLDNDPQHLYIFAKFRRKNTLCVRKGQEHMGFHHGIYIDIFPSYPIPSTKVAFYLFTFTVARLKTIMWSPIGAKSEKRFLMKLLYKLLSFIPKEIPKRIIFNMISRCKGDLELYLGSPTLIKARIFRKRLRYLNEQGNPIKVVRAIQPSGVVELEFEGFKFFAQENYDYFLTFLFGDYMKLPPEDKRVGHHDAAVWDFGEAYDELCASEQEGK